MKRTILILCLLSFISVKSYSQNKENIMTKKIIKTEEEWKKILTPEQYNILREKGTDRPSEKGYTSHFGKRNLSLFCLRSTII